ncbi:MAG TPA: polymer-forming cytoskeletal protein [Polyangiaceae bacterium]|nr:polymer-forming cytoskeletal protein [Polyangiaceae bacterium]
MTNGNQADGGKRTLVEEGTEVQGSIKSTCPVLVRGRIEGDIEAPSMTVSPSGAVHGRVKVGELKSEGEIAGEYQADTVQLSGRVRDKTVLRARSLEVKLDAKESGLQVVFGECELEVGDAPTTKAEKRKRGGATEGEPTPEPEPQG